MKKFMYLISTVLGILFVLKLLSKEGSKIVLEYPVEKSDITPKKESTKIKKSVSKLNSRQKDILKLINKRKVLLPTDIYALHPDVSTRTLRRDMTSLVESDYVRQEGSTRDTKYFLNS